MSKIRNWKQITTWKGREENYFSLYQYVKDQKLKANHNLTAVADIQIQFISVCQRSEIESKSQLIKYCWTCSRRLYQYVKDQKLKANHNIIRCVWLTSLFISVCQRSEIESKSQPHKILFLLFNVYISMSKIRNWKQITTKLMSVETNIKFISVCQRSEIESKSQRRLP